MPLIPERIVATVKPAMVGMIQDRIFAMVLALLCGAWLAALPAAHAADDRPVIGLEHEGPVRVVYQVTADEWRDGVGKGLLYLKRLHQAYVRQGYEPEDLHIHAVYHGEAADHLLTDAAWNRWNETDGGNPNTGLLSELGELGVQVELCDVRRRNNGWSKDEIHPDVALVSGAYARVIDLQLRGFAYIRF